MTRSGRELVTARERAGWYARMIASRDGEIGRRSGLKIRRSERTVGVRFPLPAPTNPLTERSVRKNSSSGITRLWCTMFGQFYRNRARIVPELLLRGRSGLLLGCSFRVVSLLLRF